MPALLQIWIVIVTIGMLAIALILLRSLTRFLGRASEDLSQLTASVRESADRIDVVSSQAEALVNSLQKCVVPVRRVVDSFEAVGQRTADLSSSLLEVLEPPVYTAAAVARGVRAGADHLLKRLLDRLTHRYASNNGDQYHE